MVLFKQCVAILCLCACYSSHAADSEVSQTALEAAQHKARQALQNVAIGTSQTVPDVSVSVGVPDLDAAQSLIVPDFLQQGHDPVTIAQRYQKRHVPDLGTGLKDAQLYVFISFSMPENSLRRIALEANKTGATLVLRGFVQGSLVQTQKQAANLGKLGAEVDINPNLFREYGVTQVPTFLMVRDSGSELGSCADSLLKNQAKCSVRMMIAGDLSLQTQLAVMLKQNNIDPVLKQAAEARLRLLQPSVAN